jgi:hypothetical protein
MGKCKLEKDEVKELLKVKVDREELAIFKAKIMNIEDFISNNKKAGKSPKRDTS